MMAGNPNNNWWSMHTSDHHQHHQQHEEVVIPTTTSLFISQTHPSNSTLLPPLQFLPSSSSSSSSSSASLLPFLASANPHHAQDFPHSWSQLLLGGLSGEHDDQERFSSPNEFEATRVVHMNNGGVHHQVNVKQELVSNQSNINNNGDDGVNNKLQLYRFREEQDHHHHQVSTGVVSNRAGGGANWSQIMAASLSPKSCITSLSSSTTNNNNNNNSGSSNMLDFATNNKRCLQDDQTHHHQHADNNTTNSECNSTAATGGVPPKKPRVQPSSTPPLKVRKEKLGDRITALHQLVSPFGKTDTASVLLEAIGYIRFLQGQIEALSSPYLGNNTNNASAKNQLSVHGERNCLFPEHPGQLLNDSCLKRRRTANQEDNKDGRKDLKSRGLCLVPISCTQLIGSDNGADYWAQSLSGGF